jgi:hypothetical protein
MNIVRLKRVDVSLIMTSTNSVMQVSSLFGAYFYGILYLAISPFPFVLEGRYG